MVNIVMGLLTVALVIAFAAVSAWHYRFVRNGEWHTFRGNRMRRMGSDGEWKTRQAAPGENDDHIHNFSM